MAACNGISFMWIQRILGVGRCGAVLPWLKTTVVCLGGKRSESHY